MGFIIFLGEAMLGGASGIGYMCCLQINRINEQKNNIKDNQGGF